MRGFFCLVTHMSAPGLTILHYSGYAVTPSHESATKIWSMESDWEYLVTKKKTSKQVLTGSNFHLDFS